MLALASAKRKAYDGFMPENCAGQDSIADLYQRLNDRDEQIARLRSQNSRDLADERAREFWERAFMKLLEYYDVTPKEIGESADLAVTEWRMRFAPTHPASIAKAAAESCANPSAWLLLGEAVDIIRDLVNDIYPSDSMDLKAIRQRGDTFFRANWQAREDWRKSR